MRPDLWAAVRRFAAHEIEVLARGFPEQSRKKPLDAEAPKTFHLLCVGLALYENDIPIADLNASLVDGFGDFSIDAIGLMLGEEPVFSPDEGEELLEQDDAADTLRIVFVQAKRESLLSEAEVIDFAARMRRFLTYSSDQMATLLGINGDREPFAAAKAVWAYWRAFDVLRKKVRRIEAKGIFAFSGDYRAPAGVQAAIRDFVEDIKAHLQQAEVSMAILGADELLGICKEAEAHTTRRFEGVSVVELPPTAGASKSFIGYVGAQALVDAIRDKRAPRGRVKEMPDERLFFDNPRGFIDPAEYKNIGVVSLRRALLDPERHDRVVLGHNGLLISGRNVTRTGSALEVAGAQILNGLQSCHALFGFDGRLAGVHVPIKVFATDDENLKDDLILASNTQQAFGEYDMLSRKREVRQLQPDFESGLPEKKLGLHLKPMAPPQGSYTRNLTPRQLMDAYVSVFFGEPHAAQGKAKVVRDRLEAGKIFAPEDEPGAYRALGWLVVRGRIWSRASRKWQWRDRFDFEPKRSDIYPARHHFVYALWWIVADKPDVVDRARSPDAYRRFERIVERLADDPVGHQLAVLAARAVDEACGSRSLTAELTSTSKFTGEVKSAAARMRGEAEKQTLLRA